jgi:hypothetical protein
LKLKDFQRAEEYIKYAQHLKDRLGDLNQMEYLDQLIFNIKNQKEKFSFENKNISNWRILTPYYCYQNK